MFADEAIPDYTAGNSGRRSVTFDLFLVNCNLPTVVIEVSCPVSSYLVVVVIVVVRRHVPFFLLVVSFLLPFPLALKEHGDIHGLKTVRVLGGERREVSLVDGREVCGVRQGRRPDPWHKRRACAEVNSRPA